MQCHQSTVVSATIITTPTLISSLLRETSQHEWIFHVHGHTKSVVYLSNPFKRLSQKPYQFQKPDQPHLQYFDLWGYFSCVEARRSSVACKSWRICILRCSIKNRWRGILQRDEKKGCWSNIQKDHSIPLLCSQCPRRPVGLSLTYGTSSWSCCVTASGPSSCPSRAASPEICDFAPSPRWRHWGRASQTRGVCCSLPVMMACGRQSSHGMTLGFPCHGPKMLT